MSEQPIPEICDYEGSTYRVDFWEGQGRDYEDRVERIAIRRLLPSSGDCLLDVGAGYGRYTALFEGYRQVVFLDYSLSQLESARQRYGDDGFLYVAANVYQMPFAPGVFDTVTMIRVLHHMQDPPQALRSVRMVMRQHGIFLLEFANKRNLKAIVRWLLHRQDWNPFDREPVEFVKLNYDFHPRYVRDTLVGAGFKPGRTLTVSHFRLALLKRLVPTGVLVALDSLSQLTGAVWQFTPSVFVRNEAVGTIEAALEGTFWRCPSCGSLDLKPEDELLICQGCKARWGRVNGVYNFKEPLSG
ncbi:MAG: class I SAM-dependent methyltransferase [Anaerolineae bacterium]|nr:class I SAM-dependent methyltransferase [Anaerolineae bacterium]